MSRRPPTPTRSWRPCSTAVEAPDPLLHRHGLLWRAPLHRHDTRPGGGHCPHHRGHAEVDGIGAIQILLFHFEVHRPHAVHLMGSTVAARSGGHGRRLTCWCSPARVSRSCRRRRDVVLSLWRLLLATPYCGVRLACASPLEVRDQSAHLRARVGNCNGSHGCAILTSVADPGANTRRRNALNAPAAGRRDRGIRRHGDRRHPRLLHCAR
mmetsp:Transcript_43062/g.93773  ORF Transcript_43062/g.93773 Transcript_43062/m.93773 type:complete len:210 (+) Transcript_43062:185-814(+)